jgi:hypothetical protein
MNLPPGQKPQLPRLGPVITRVHSGPLMSVIMWAAPRPMPWADQRFRRWLTDRYGLRLSGRIVSEYAPAITMEMKLQG